MTPRYAALDLARLMAVVMMIQGHAIGTFAAPGTIADTTAAGMLYMALRGATSVTFLLVSGLVNFAGLRRDGQGRVLPAVLWRRLRRGVGLILIDDLLVLPARRIPEFFTLDAEQWFSFFAVGTLNLIGVSLILLTVVMAVTRSDRAFAAASLAAGVGIAAATPFVHGVDWFAALPAAAAHYLTYAGGSHFPVFPYTAFLFFGAALGPRVLGWLRDEGRWTAARALVAGGAGLVASAFVLSPLTPWLPPHEYWLSSPFLVAGRTGAGLVLIGAYTALYQCTRGASGLYAALSRKTIHIYVVHILAIFGHTWFSPPTLAWHGRLTLVEGIGAMLLVAAVSFGAGLALVWVDRRRHRAYQVLRVAAAVMLGYLLWYGV